MHSQPVLQRKRRSYGARDDRCCRPTHSDDRNSSFPRAQRNRVSAPINCILPFLPEWVTTGKTNGTSVVTGSACAGLADLTSRIKRWLRPPFEGSFVR